jgi:hypothetical protein
MFLLHTRPNLVLPISGTFGSIGLFYYDNSCDTLDDAYLGMRLAPF